VLSTDVVAGWGCVRRQTDMKKLMVTFRDFANVLPTYEGSKKDTVRQIKTLLGNVFLGFLPYISQSAGTLLERTTVLDKSCLYFYRAVPTLLCRLLDLVTFLCV